MTPEELVSWLAAAAPGQRDKLAQLRADHVGTIRMFGDGDFQAVIRAIKKRLGSPKLAAEVAALIADLTRDRVARPIEAAPVVEPAAVPWIGTSADHNLTALEAAIAADPEAQGPYTVLGDYLVSLGDVRGELITIGHALAKNPTHKAMRARWMELLDAHATAVWGPEVDHPNWLLEDVDWYMGFIRGCRITRTRSAPADALLRALLDDPAPARFIQRLAVASHLAPATLAPIIGAIATRPRPTLRVLALGQLGSPIGDVSALWPAVGYLRELRLSGHTPDFGTPDAPRLERLAIDFCDGGDDPLAAIAPILAGDGLPALRSLALTNFPDGDALCAALVRSPRLPQLAELDLDMGTVTGAGAATLHEHRERLAHLRRLNLDLNLVPADTPLATLPNVTLGDQRDPDQGRYPAAWE